MPASLQSVLLHDHQYKDTKFIIEEKGHFETLCQQYGQTPDVFVPIELGGYDFVLLL